MAYWRTKAAIVVWVALFAGSLLMSRVPYIAPLSFLVVVLIAWDHGLRPALIWIGVVHVLIPGLLIVLGTGPFFVFAEERPLVAMIMGGSLVAVTALAYLTAWVRSLTEELRSSRSAILQVNEQLKAALDEVKELRGLLPICAWCKDIRDVSGEWENLESYIARHSRATFTHGLCPKCLQEQLRLSHAELTGP
jgi:hypothetical protein